MTVLEAPPWDRTDDILRRAGWRRVTWGPENLCRPRDMEEAEKGLLLLSHSISELDAEVERLREVVRALQEPSAGGQVPH